MIILLVAIFLLFFGLAFILAQGLCLAFAPVAGLISAFTARRRRLSAIRYSLLGTIGAACFIMPWVYLMWRMKGSSISNLQADNWHAVLHVSWLLCLGGAASGYSFISAESPSFPLRMQDMVVWSYLLVCLGMWIGTLLYFTSNGGFSGQKRLLAPSELTHRSRIAPFVGAFVTMAILVGPTVVNFIFDPPSGIPR